MPRAVVAVILAVALAACGPQATERPGASGTRGTDAPPTGGDSGRVTTLATDPSPTPAADRDVVLYAVGDIASCRSRDDERVAALLRRRHGPIALLGDAVYDRGSLTEYRECFDPAWGPMRKRLRPAPGNHDYRTPGAAGYFAYFGRRAGDAGKGWYHYDLGAHWRVVVLNSNCTSVGGCDAESPQGRWLARTLASRGDRHVLAYWHAPLFSTGMHGPNPMVAPLWRLLQRGGAKLVLGGHDHVYERFAPQGPGGRARQYGIRQFTVGTGGYTLYRFSREPLPTTEVRDNTSFGVLRLRLQPDGYRWRFIPVTGAFSDRGYQPLTTP